MSDIAGIVNFTKIKSVIHQMIGQEIPVLMAREAEPYYSDRAIVTITVSEMRPEGVDDLRHTLDSGTNLLVWTVEGTRRFTLSFKVTADEYDQAQNIAQRIWTRFPQSWYYRQLLTDNIAFEQPLSCVDVREVWDTKEVSSVIIDFAMRVGFTQVFDEAPGGLPGSVGTSDNNDIPGNWIETVEDPERNV